MRCSSSPTPMWALWRSLVSRASLTPSLRSARDELLSALALGAGAPLLDAVAGELREDAAACS